VEGLLRFPGVFPVKLFLRAAVGSDEKDDPLWVKPNVKRLESRRFLRAANVEAT
jgi:hypothetical protein